jgi:hypothetical protein
MKMGTILISWITRPSSSLPSPDKNVLPVRTFVVLFQKFKEVEKA